MALITYFGPISLWEVAFLLDDGIACCNSWFCKMKVETFSAPFRRPFRNLCNDHSPPHPKKMLVSRNRQCDLRKPFRWESFNSIHFKGTLIFAPSSVTHWSITQRVSLFCHESALSSDDWLFSSQALKFKWCKNWSGGWKQGAKESNNWNLKRKSSFELIISLSFNEISTTLFRNQGIQASQRETGQSKTKEKIN